jgi:hypothetical protein
VRAKKLARKIWAGFDCSSFIFPKHVVTRLNARRKMAVSRFQVAAAHKIFYRPMLLIRLPTRNLLYQHCFG